MTQPMISIIPSFRRVTRCAGMFCTACDSIQTRKLLISKANSTHFEADME
jgi:hypothetical protein